MSLPGFSFLLFAIRHGLCIFDVGGVTDSYLVRRTDNNPHMLVGVVEEPGVKEKKAFHNLQELWDILNPVKKVQMSSEKSKNSKRSQNH